MPDYPDAWARLVTESGCPDLNGWYTDKGRAYMGARYNPSIYLLILRGSVSDMDDAEFLKITQSDDQVKLETYLANRSLMKALSFRIGSGTCRNGFLKLDVRDTDELISREGDLNGAATLERTNWDDPPCWAANGSETTSM